MEKVKKGMFVRIKLNTQNHEEREGIVRRVLASHNEETGTKVILESGDKGIVVKILPQSNTKISKEIIDKDIASGKQIINIKDMDLTKSQKYSLFSKMNQRHFSVVTNFFKSTYLKSLKSEISGVVIFKVEAANITAAIFKINLYLKKYSVDKDLKYNIIKVDS